MDESYEGADSWDIILDLEWKCEDITNWYIQNLSWAVWFFYKKIEYRAGAILIFNLAEELTMLPASFLIADETRDVKRNARINKMTRDIALAEKVIAPFYIDGQYICNNIYFKM